MTTHQVLSRSAWPAAAPGRDLRPAASSGSLRRCWTRLGPRSATRRALPASSC